MHARIWQLTSLFFMTAVLLCGTYGHAANWIHAFSCKECHMTGLATGDISGNLCLKCHDSPTPMVNNYDQSVSTAGGLNPQDASDRFSRNPLHPTTTGQTSHNWAAPDAVSAAGAQPPTQGIHPEFYDRISYSLGKVTCSRCHDPHGTSDNPQLLRKGPDSADAMCLACHTAWNQQNNDGFMTHPVGVDYGQTVTDHPGKYRTTPSPHASSSVQLVGGKVSCTSCHGAHYVDSDNTTADIAANAGNLTANGGDGRLLRGNGAGRADKASLCQTCHAYLSHGSVTGETVGCQVCHSGHVYNEDLPNYFVLRSSASTATFSTVDGLDYSNPLLALDAAQKFKLWNDRTDGSANGYCERCHGDAKDINNAEYHVTLAVCTDCHKHDNELGGFSANCGACHGNGETQEAWPDGIANNILDGYSWADDAGSHATHVQAIGTRNVSCPNCHPGNPPVDHYLDDTTGLQQAEVTRMETSGDATPEYWRYAEGPTASSGTPVYMKTVTGSDDTDAYFRQGNKTCYNIDCHGGTDLTWGGSGCLSCHDSQRGSRAAVTDHFSADSHHIQGTAVTNAHCYQCHWEANSNGTINPAYHGGVFFPGAAVDLVIYGAGLRPANYLEGATAVRYTADGSRAQISSLNLHCLGCHSDQNSTTQPFGDGKTPQEYAWDGTSVDSRYSQTGTTTFGKYTGQTYAARKDQQKAYSAHGNATDNEGGWSPTSGLDYTLPNTRAGSVNVACYDCHNAHGSDVTGKATSYNSATLSGGLLKDTQAGVGGYNIDYQPLEGGSSDYKNRRNPGASLCMDCHMTADGGGSQPWGYQSTFGATSPILGYFDSAYFAPGPSGARTRYPYKATNSYVGGHFGASSPLNSAAMGSIDGLCTPCHDPHGVSPTLSSQAYGVPLLKGTWLTSFYREDVARSSSNLGYSFNFQGNYHIDQNTFGNSRTGIYNGPATKISENATLFAGLCLNCHPKVSLTDGVTHTWKSKDRIHESVRGWKNWGTAKHGFPCSKCHTPHNNTVLPRLMVTNCLDPNHQGRVAWNESPNLSNQSNDPYWGGSGRFPGSRTYCDDSRCYDRPITCHDSANANNGASGGKDQSWNNVTPWAPPLVISDLDAAQSYAGSEARETITWTTNLGSDSSVEYWWDPGDVKTAESTSRVTSHSVPLTGLDNHKTYTIRARSTRQVGNTLHEDTADNSFYISLPPTVPGLIDEPDNHTCTAAECPVRLEWNASSDPVDNGTIEYYAELSENASFTPVLYNTAWNTDTYWNTATLPTNATYYWRVRSRDAAFTGANDPPSAWTSDPFTLTDGQPPTITLTYPGTSNYGGYEGSYMMTFQWSSSTPGEFRVQVSTDPSFATSVIGSGWISATYWSTTLTHPSPSSTTYYWRVQGRLYDGTTGAWTPTSPETRAFTIIDYGTSSCPFLFNWDGEKFAFEADLYGAGKLAIKTKFGYLRPNPHDYYILKAPPVIREGFWELRLVEERFEADYLDELKFYTVDTPDNVKLFAEKPQAGSSTPFTGLHDVLHTISGDASVPRSIIHVNTGDDVTAQLSADDDVFVVLNDDRNIDFTYQTLELDLGDIQSESRVKIAMDAMSMFPDSPEGVERARTFGPRTKLEVQDEQGSWVSVPSSVGSLPKAPEFSRPYVFDISDIWVSDSRKVRFTFLFKTYVDFIWMDTSEDVPLNMTEIPMLSAQLVMRGIDHLSSNNELYEYVYGEATGVTAYLPGYYTRFGDVRALLDSSDDKFVIYGGGDEIQMAFTPLAQPGTGVKRWYLVYTNGYYKDVKVDVPHTVEPLPFADMSNFPYDESVEHYPDDAEHNAYRAEYNTRLIEP